MASAFRIRLRGRTPQGVVLAVLAAGLTLTHAEVFRAGAARFVALAPSGSLESMHPLRGADVTFEAWLVARHARTLVREPWRLFDTPHCAPAERTLTLGVPAIALGILGIPASLVGSEPLFVYNCARVAANLACALAMYCLVSRWTGRRAAGLAASLLFAFRSIRHDLASHPPEWDLSWTVLGLFFAERLAAAGRWRDATGLALCGAMQIAASFYALIASTLLALPFGVWLLLRREPRRATPAQLAFVAGCVALSAALLLGPYLASRSAGRIGGRTFFFFASWQDYGPDGRMFPGFALLLSALFGMLVPRRFALRGVAGDPRPALVGAAALAAFLAAGPATARALQGWGVPLPAFDPYAGLARVLPGLDSIRDVSLLGTSVYLVACLLAGLGFGVVIDSARRWQGAVGAALVALALLDVSECGAFLATPGPLPLGTRLQLQLSLPAGPQRLAARVVRVQEPGWGHCGGVGVRFESASSAASAALRSLLAETPGEPAPA